MFSKISQEEADRIKKQLKQEKKNKEQKSKIEDDIQKIKKDVARETVSKHPQMRKTVMKKEKSRDTVKSFRNSEMNDSILSCLSSKPFQKEKQEQTKKTFEEKLNRELFESKSPKKKNTNNTSITKFRNEGDADTSIGLLDIADEFKQSDKNYNNGINGIKKMDKSISTVEKENKQRFLSQNRSTLLT